MSPVFHMFILAPLVTLPKSACYVTKSGQRLLTRSNHKGSQKIGQMAVAMRLHLNLSSTILLQAAFNRKISSWVISVITLRPDIVRKGCGFTVSGLRVLRTRVQEISQYAKQCNLTSLSRRAHCKSLGVWR